MSDIKMTDDLFFNRAGLDRANVEGVVAHLFETREHIGKDDSGLGCAFALSHAVSFRKFV